MRIMSQAATVGAKAPWSRGLPLPVAMLLAALALGIAGGMDTAHLLAALDAGFGGSLGSYALILIPSFTLAAALAGEGDAVGSGRAAAFMAPFAGAAMICPDTAYAALGPMAGRRRLSVLFGAYAGFKLLVPAGPAIIGTALGGLSADLIALSLPVFLVAWGVGWAYARRFEPGERARRREAGGPLPRRVLAPLATLAGLLALGFVLRGRWTPPALLDFLLDPKGALLAAGVVALVPLAGPGRAAAIESGMRRTGPLLLTIGSASAFGAMLVAVLPVERWAQALVGTGLVLPALFIFTASFKLAKGSSMATFAGTSGIVAALLPGLGVSPALATLAMCAGAFVTIAPNDSLYWLARQDALPGRDGAAITRILAGGATLQGLAALAVVLAFQAAGW
ncbi:conserved membrane protein of unknown function [Rhodovastum atsumiense]|nr:conserved membrane protein of unknown function [Rhodovastum atsumiense]